MKRDWTTIILVATVLVLIGILTVKLLFSPGWYVSIVFILMFMALSYVLASELKQTKI